MRRDEIIKALRCFAREDNCPVDECNKKCPYWMENDKFDIDNPNAEISDGHQLCCAAADLLEQDGKLINSTRQVEWVSVDKKLPYHRQDCRVILNGDFSQDYPATYREYGPGPGFGVYDWTDCEFQFYLNVTNWRAKPLYNVKEAKHDP